MVRFCQFILSGKQKILASFKGRNSVKILRKMTGNNPKLDFVNNDVHTKYGQILCIFLKILSGNKILTSIKGCNSIKILRKMTGNNPKLVLVNVDVHTKFGQILLIVLKILSGNKILMSIKGRNSIKFAKNYSQQSQARSCQC